MRPIFKTWLTICLLLPLAAHATNREQHLPSGFTGYTAKSSASAPYVASTSKTVARPASSKAHRKAPGKIAAASLAAANKQSSTVLSRAVNVLGTPYRWGGSSPSKGFDCSGLVKYAFNDVAPLICHAPPAKWPAAMAKRSSART